jgi:2-polyprenyl-3-methyl-5-hydroxy-6-metoxy-1,4-benzoquinol methylase
MSRSYREALFESYNSTHVAHLDADDQSKLEYFREHVRLNYLPVLGNLDRENSRILEVACNKGYLLAALDSFQFKQLTGIDLSPVDVDKARQLIPAVNVSCVDAFTYLEEHASEFDVVIMKAVLEHVEKDRVLPLLEKIATSLRPGGLVLVDVPNMDWIFGQHERYMDFTHEVGFTRESLAQVMRQVFAEVRVQKAKPAMLGSVERVARCFVIFWMQIALRIIGEGASDTWWDSRAIIGIGKKRI